jgi:hypothetical protein
MLEKIHWPPRTQSKGDQGPGLLMDINKMIAELREEREQVEEAMLTLERLARGRGRRRGRPPSWLKEVAGSHLNIGQAQRSNGGTHIDAQKGPGHPPGSKKQSPQPVKVGWHTTESLTDGEPDL